MLDGASNLGLLSPLGAPRKKGFWSITDIFQTVMVTRYAMMAECQMQEGHIIRGTETEN